MTTCLKSEIQSRFYANCFPSVASVYTFSLNEIKLKGRSFKLTVITSDFPQTSIDRQLFKILMVHIRLLQKISREGESETKRDVYKLKTLLQRSESKKKATSFEYKNQEHKGLMVLSTKMPIHENGNPFNLESFYYFLFYPVFLLYAWCLLLTTLSIFLHLENFCCNQF